MIEADELRERLATVTAEREEAKAARERLDQDWKRRHSAWLEQQAQDVRAHAETRKALESSRAKYGCYKHSAMQTVGLLRIQLDSTRAELAKALENSGRYSSAYADIKKELKDQKRLADAAVLEANESERELYQTRKALEELRAKYDADLSNAEVAHQLELAKAEARVKELLRQKEAAWKGYGAKT